jgi:hypothetical protein
MIKKEAGSGACWQGDDEIQRRMLSEQERESKRFLNEMKSDWRCDEMKRGTRLSKVVLSLYAALNAKLGKNRIHTPKVGGPKIHSTLKSVHS